MLAWRRRRNGWKSAAITNVEATMTRGCWDKLPVKLRTRACKARQQRTDAEDPANRILRAARGNECSNRRECQQNQGIKNITEQPRGRILHLKQQRNDGNDQVECPGEPCKTKGSAPAHGFSFPG